MSPTFVKHLDNSYLAELIWGEGGFVSNLASVLSNSVFSQKELPIQGVERCVGNVQHLYKYIFWYQCLFVALLRSVTALMRRYICIGNTLCDHIGFGW